MLLNFCLVFGNIPPFNAVLSTYKLTLNPSLATATPSPSHAPATAATSSSQAVAKTSFRSAPATRAAKRRLLLRAHARTQPTERAATPNLRRPFLSPALVRRTHSRVTMVRIARANVPLVRRRAVWAPRRMGVLLELRKEEMLQREQDRVQTPLAARIEQSAGLCMCVCVYEYCITCGVGGLVGWMDDVQYLSFFLVDTHDTTRHDLTTMKRQRRGGEKRLFYIPGLWYGVFGSEALLGKKNTRGIRGFEVFFFFGFLVLPLFGLDFFGTIFLFLPFCLFLSDHSGERLFMVFL